MRNLAPCLLAATMGVIAAPAAAEDLTIASGLGLESRYVFRGVQFAQTSLQPSLTLSKDGFHVGAWFNLPVGDDDNLAPLTGEELDLVAGYSFPLVDFVTLDVGLTWYVFPEAMDGFFDFHAEDGDGSGVNTLEPYVSLAFDIPLAPTVTLYRDFMYDTLTLQATATHSFPLATAISLDLSGMLGYVVDDAIGADYLYGVASAQIACKVSGKAKAYAGVRYGGSDLAGGSLFDDLTAGTRQSAGLWWGIGLSASF